MRWDASGEMCPVSCKGEHLDFRIILNGLTNMEYFFLDCIIY